MSIIKGAGEGLICHKPKSTNVFIIGEGWIQSVNYKRGRQSTRRRPEVHTFAWKIAQCIAPMGVNNMRDL